MLCEHRCCDSEALLRMNGCQFLITFRHFFLAVEMVRCFDGSMPYFGVSLMHLNGV